MVTQRHLANALRFLSVDMIDKAKSGHPGMPLGMADIATVLWTKFLKFDISHPAWYDRDRFVLSNGHGSALLYSLLHVTGYKDISIEDLKNFRQLDSKTAGHPEMDLLDGVDYSTGPLGQGLAGAVGMALAERMMNARYGDDLVNHKTYVFVGDGCLMEGLSEEAVSLAGHLNLNRLIVLWDNNAITIDGSTAVSTSTDMHKRFEANGWRVLSCDGHDFDDIENALLQAQTSDKPVLIDCKTTIGYGSPQKAGKSAAHGAPLGSEETAALRLALEWPYEPFDIPSDIRALWRAAGLKGEGAYQLWQTRVSSSNKRDAFLAQCAGQLPPSFHQDFEAFKKELLGDKKPLASRKSSQKVLGELTRLIPNLIGGSADLTGANYTDTPTSVPVTKDNYMGNYINYGIREHVMAAVMAGMAVHGGFIPYGGTFLSFVDYMKPAIRLTALMGQRVLYVLTHDSIGVGEDGPTHQPIEQLAGLRATPNVLVFRPADAVEVAECYEVALEHAHNPSAMILSRQELPLLRDSVTQNKSSKGAYVLFEPDTPRKVTLIATGSEVALAMAAKDELATLGIAAGVVSMPCMELFAHQPPEYRQLVLGSAPRLAIEAASSFGWCQWTGDTGGVIGLDRFGQSAPGKELFKKFGFTKEAVVDMAVSLIK